MYLVHRHSGDLVEVLNLEALFDPFQKEVSGRFHSGKELQEPAAFAKGDLVFPSDEYLPRCWLDPACITKLHAAGGQAGIGHYPHVWPDYESEHFKAKEQSA